MFIRSQVSAEEVNALCGSGESYKKVNLLKYILPVLLILCLPLAGADEAKPPEKNVPPPQEELGRLDQCYVPPPSIFSRVRKFLTPDKRKIESKISQFYHDKPLIMIFSVVCVTGILVFTATKILYSKRIISKQPPSSTPGPEPDCWAVK